MMRPERRSLRASIAHMQNNGSFGTASVAADTGKSVQRARGHQRAVRRIDSARSPADLHVEPAFEGKDDLVIGMVMSVGLARIGAKIERKRMHGGPPLGFCVSCGRDITGIRRPSETAGSDALGPCISCV